VLRRLGFGGGSSSFRHDTYSFRAPFSADLLVPPSTPDVGR
jgi:hypothetical protein